MCVYVYILYIQIYILYIYIWKKGKKVAFHYLIFIVSRYIGLAEKKSISRFMCNVEGFQKVWASDNQCNGVSSIKVFCFECFENKVEQVYRTWCILSRFLREFGCRTQCDVSMMPRKDRMSMNRNWKSYFGSGEFWILLLFARNERNLFVEY